MPAGAPAYVPLKLPNAYKRFTRQELTFPYSPDSPGSPQRVDQSGLLLGILISVAGSVHVPAAGGAPTPHPEAPYNLISALTLSGGGPGSIITIPGYALMLMERARESSFVPSFSFAPAAGGGGGSVTPFEFDIHMSVAVRDGDLYGEWSDYAGAIYTGDPSLSLQLGVAWSDPTTVFTANTAGVTIDAVATATTFKLDTPNPSADPGLLAAISWSHQLITEVGNFPFAASGPLGVPQLPTAQPRAYLRVLDIVRNNPDATFVRPQDGVLASILSTLQDTVDFERNISEQVWQARQDRRYADVLPVGTYISDFAAGNRRDNWLPVGNLSMFTIIPTISGAPTLAGSYFQRFSEVVIPSAYAAKWLQAASPEVLKAALAIGG